MHDVLGLRTVNTDSGAYKVWIHQNSNTAIARIPTKKWCAEQFTPKSKALLIPWQDRHHTNRNKIHKIGSYAKLPNRGAYVQRLDRRTTTWNAGGLRAVRPAAARVADAFFFLQNPCALARIRLADAVYRQTADVHSDSVTRKSRTRFATAVQDGPNLGLHLVGLVKKAPG